MKLRNLLMLSALITTLGLVIFWGVQPVISFSQETNSPQTPVSFNPDTLMQGKPSGELYLQAKALSLKAPKDALTLLQDLEANDPFYNQPLYWIHANFSLARTYLNLGLPEESFAVIQAVYDKADELDILWAKAMSTKNMAAQYAKRGDLNTATSMLHQALAMSKSIQYDRLTMSTYNVIAITNSIQGNRNRALHYYQAGLEIAKNYPADPTETHIITNLGFLYAQSKNWKQALKYSDDAIERYDQSNLEELDALIMPYVTKATVYMNTGQTDLAHEYLDKVSQVLSDISPARLKMIAYRTMASLHLRESNTKASQQALDMCFHVPNADLYGLELGRCHGQQAKLSIAEKHYEQSLKQISQALSLFEAVPSTIDIKDSLKVLSDVYAKLGDYDKAYQLLDAYHTKNNELLFGEREFAFNQMQEAYQAQLKQEEIALLKSEKALSDSREAQDRLRIILFIVLAMASFIAFAFQRIQSKLIKERNTSLESSNKELTKEALEDPLTGLHNRRYVETFLNDLRQMPTSATSQHRYTLAILDLDHFKAVNDTYGHDIGDEVLIQTGHRLQQLLEQTAIVARWGGEEFLCAIEQPKHGDEQAVLKAINDTIRRTPITTRRGEVFVTASIGAITTASLQQALDNWDGLLKNADELLYKAKQSGRDQFQALPFSISPN